MQKEVEIKPKTSICSKCWVQKGSKVNFQFDWEWNVQTLVSESATRPRFLLSLSCRQQNIANSLQMSQSAFFKCDLPLFIIISPIGNIFWKENNVGSLQPAKTSWWVANAEMIICELKRNSKSHSICLKHWFLPLVAILTVKLWTVPIPQNSLAEHIDFRLQIAHNE